MSHKLLLFEPTLNLINSASTPFARFRSTPCSRPSPDIPALRWRWRRWSIRSGIGFCASIRKTRSGPIGIASYYRTAMLRCCSGRHSISRGTRAVNADYERLGEPSVTLDDIRRFRQLDSKAPGHPEYHWVSGVETTTGPLGQGVATSVGMAIAREVARQPLQPTRLRDLRLQHLRRLRRWLPDGGCRRPKRHRWPVISASTISAGSTTTTTSRSRGTRA